MFDKAIQFLKDHKEIALATSEGNLPKLRIFQIMKQEGHVLYFRWIYDHNPVLSRLYTSYDQMEYFCLPIAEMDYYNLSPTPPIFQHFDLISGEIGNGFVGERYKNNQ